MGTQNQTKHNIIQMLDIKTHMEIQIISYYKYAIWLYSSLARKFRTTIDRGQVQHSIHRKFIKDVEFYKQRIAHKYT